jgi:hypothetical protein
MVKEKAAEDKTVKWQQLGCPKEECFSCLEASWRYSPGHYYYPTFSHCKAEAENCQLRPMSPGTAAFVKTLYLRSKREGRIR